jgi:hypothetical protein
MVQLHHEYRTNNYYRSWGDDDIVVLGFFYFNEKVENKIPAPTVHSNPAKSDLIAVVQKWDDLKNICVSNGLTEATAKLDEIFPMLIKVDK